VGQTNWKASREGALGAGKGVAFAIAGAGIEAGVGASGEKRSRYASRCCCWCCCCGCGCCGCGCCFCFCSRPEKRSKFVRARCSLTTPMSTLHNKQPTKQTNNQTNKQTNAHRTNTHRIIFKIPQFKMAYFVGCDGIGGCKP